MTVTLAPNFIIVANPDALAIEAADRIIAHINENGAGRSAICLTGGSGPRRLYEMLGGDYAAKIDWRNVHWFIGDDRFVAPDDPLNNMAEARRVVLDRLAPPENIHAMPADAASPDEAAKRYEQELKTFYGAEALDPARSLFDVVLMGLGPDGHTASLFPAAPAVDEKTKWVCGVSKANVAPFVPRVTLTLPTLASCREMIFLVGGSGKQAILSKVRADTDLPATRARSNHQTTWLVDRAAAGQTA